MAELQQAPRPAQENVVSDVLASIRRLIAQDGRQLPGRPLHDQPLAGDSRFVLAHDDLIAPENAPPETARLQLVSITPPPDEDCWQPTQITDWPAPVQSQPAPDLGTLYGDALTPEEEAEFAEAEAALAAMTASTRAEQAEPEPELAPEPPVPVETEDAAPLNLFAPPPLDEEAALREVIRDAIRAELQGEFGERLSTNIRHVIRDEVESVIRELCAQG